MRILKINSVFHCNEFPIIEVVQVNANGCDIRDSGGSEVKASASNAGDQGSIPGLGRSPGEGNGNPLQYSCLESPRDRGAWWAAVYGVVQSQTRLKRLSSSSSSRPSKERILIQSLVEGEGEVAQSCPTLCDPVDCSLPGFSVHGIFQARILEWVTISFSRGSSRPRD